VIKTVDVSYGGEIGFNQAIELSAETLGSVKLVQEKRLLQKYFDEISQDTGKYCFMVEDTLRALELGAVETLVVWENLDMDRITLRNHALNQDKTLHLCKSQQANEQYFHDTSTGVELEITHKIPLVEFLANNYKSFGTTLEFVTNRSQEGAQFCRGFGGIGGILRWRVDFLGMDMAEDD
jgi:peptide chain release factor subunit 1|tara:strand:+ start:207 stop:746 length:540 start_codon:yes stop_codon:yes gene_type:complete